MVSAPTARTADSSAVGGRNSSGLSSGPVMLDRPPALGEVCIFDCGEGFAAPPGEGVPGLPFVLACHRGLREPGPPQMPEAPDADRAGDSEDHAGQKQGDLEAAKE